MLRVRLKASPLLVVSLAAVHLSATVILLPLDLHVGVKAAVTFAIAASLFRAIWLHALLRAKSSIVALELEDQERCAVHTRAGIVQDVRILGTTYATPALTVINVKAAGARFPRHILLLKDTVLREDFRQLRVLLRWAHSPKTRKTVPI